MNVSETKLTPLDQIWQTEAEITRQIAAAREEAEQILTSAKSKIAQLKIQAREAGRREGEAQFRQIVAEAEEEARALTAQANSQAEVMRRRGVQSMENAVRLAVNIIIGIEGRV